MLEDTCERGFDIHIRGFQMLFEKKKFEETKSEAFS